MKQPIHIILTVLLCLALLAACGSQGTDGGGEDPGGPDAPPAVPTAPPANTPEPEPTPTPVETATLGRSVFVDSSGVVFWTWDSYLCSALLDGEGGIYDFVIEAQTTSHIFAVAVYESYLYMAQEDGVFRYSLEDMYAGTASPEMITEYYIDDGFEIYDGYIYYSYGRTLYSTPVGGGEEVKVARDVEEFSVTSEGIYFSSVDGGLYLTAPDGSLQQRLFETEAGCLFTLDGDSILYRCHENDQIFRASLSDGSVTVVNKRSALSDYSCVWVCGESLVFETKDFDIRSYLEGGETLLADSNYYPYRYEGFVSGGILYGSKSYLGKLCLYDPAGGRYVEYDMETELAEQLNAAADPSVDATTGATADDGYDIASGLSGDASTGGVSCDHFSLVMPAGVSWHWEVNGSRSISFYYTPAYQSGYGGHLVTIEAYDLGDTSYEEMPSWLVLGSSGTKQYVAFFPTDVQFDYNDALQQAEYPALLDYVYQMEDASSSPFTLY